MNRLATKDERRCPQCNHLMKTPLVFAAQIDTGETHWVASVTRHTCTGCGYSYETPNVSRSYADEIAAAQAVRR
jgi:rubredoxin